jgi:hypothetical protein
LKRNKKPPNKERIFYFINAWSLTLWEERRLRVFENCAEEDSKRDEVTGEWRRLANESTYNLYSSPNIVRVSK